MSHISVAKIGLLALLAAWTAPLSAQVAIRGEKIYTMAGAAIEYGTIVIKNGKITSIGSSDEINIPNGFPVLDAVVVTPGLIDAHSVVGLSGLLNQDHDQDQIEQSSPIQPELRALDAYNAHDELVAWVRSFGVTTLHTGHAPGALITGQTMIVKTRGNTVEEAMVSPATAIAATLGTAAQGPSGKSPGTRGKMMAMLREQLIKAREYLQKQSSEDESDDEESSIPRDLKLETLTRVLKGELPLMITANRAQDIASALRLAAEFDVELWLDGAAEAYLLVEDIKAAGVPVIIHPSMARAVGDRENQSFETASKLIGAGVHVVMQSGFEAYVPKTRVVLFEAAVAAANGLSFDQALATITIDAAELLGIDDRVGSLEIGKDGDIALYDGDPFEYTSHCVGVIIDGEVVSEEVR